MNADAPLSKNPPARVHLAFYKFVELADAAALAVWLRSIAPPLRGSILLAREGINGVVAGAEPALSRFQLQLTADPRFADISFKRSACTTEPFGRLKVQVKPEIVAVGLPPEEAPVPRAGGVSLDPQAWRDLLTEDNVVLLDNRNSFEFRLGHFKGATDPGVSHFRDFPKFVETHATEWRAAGKRVAMYCTGGIRCEKTAGWMQHTLGLDVYQLEGGVLNYFQSLPDAEREWQGECFVFDNRIALDTRLNETATTPDDVYADEPDGDWRLQRAKRLDDASR